MNTKKGFVHWYYTDGLLAFLDHLKVIVLFIARFFSLSLLVRTLFSPWHRDISVKQWRGFRPLLSAHLLIGNVLSRMVGAVVRLVVIIFSLFVMVCVLLIGVALFIVYFGVPGMIFVVFILFASGYFLFALCLLALLVLIFVWARVTYNRFFHVPYQKMDLFMLMRQKWFDRVWEGIGVSHKHIPPVDAHSVSSLEKFLHGEEVSLDEFEKIVDWEMYKQQERESQRQFFSAAQLKKIRPIALHWHYGYTHSLNRFSRDLTHSRDTSHADTPFFGHDRSMEMLELVMHRPEDNNALILGAPGVGRRALVQAFARRISDGHYDGTALMHARVLEVDLAEAVARAEELGQDPELAVDNFFYEAAHAGNIILFLDHFEQYMDATRGFSYPLIIEKYAGLPSFRIIAVTSEEHFHTSIEDRESMLAHFDLLQMEEMDHDTAIQILFHHFYRSEHTIFTFQAFREIIADSSRYTNTGPLPQRAIALATEVEIYWRRCGGAGPITPAIVQKFVTEKTGIPLGAITSDEKEHLLSLEDHIHENIVGQDTAVRVVSEAVRRMRSGMARSNRPAGSFLFLGPTGVGKTEMAKTLAREYFGDEEKIVRLDMSEFHGVHALDTLIGSRILQQKGRLATLVADQPYGVLLLDEIEKADVRVLDLFLQILDEGFAHDGYGEKMRFQTMIIIATSNAGSAQMLDLIERGISLGAMRDAIVDAITTNGIFRIEFLNRFDDVVLFEPIRDDAVLRIAQLLLEKFSDRVNREQNITIEFDPDVALIVVERGFKEKFGARSLLRYIDESVADALAKKLITGDVQRGDTIAFLPEDLDL